MKIDYQQVIKNLIGVISIEEISKKTGLPELEVQKIFDGKDVFISFAESNMMMRIHFRECEELHSDLIK